MLRASLLHQFSMPNSTPLMGQRWPRYRYCSTVSPPVPPNTGGEYKRPGRIQPDSVPSGGTNLLCNRQREVSPFSTKSTRIGCQTFQILTKIQAGSGIAFISLCISLITGNGAYFMSTLIILLKIAYLSPLSTFFSWSTSLFL